MLLHIKKSIIKGLLLHCILISRSFIFIFFILFLIVALLLLLGSLGWLLSCCRLLVFTLGLFLFSAFLHGSCRRWWCLLWRRLWFSSFPWSWGRSSRRRSWLLNWWRCLGLWLRGWLRWWLGLGHYNRLSVADLLDGSFGLISHRRHSLALRWHARGHHSTSGHGHRIHSPLWHLSLLLSLVFSLIIKF